MSDDFFDDVAVNHTLTRLAECDRLTIFVGAGASMEVGLPSWWELVDRLLRRVAVDRGLTEDEIDVFADGVLAEADGVIGAATVIRQHFGSSQFTGDADDFIRQALYAGEGSGDLVDPPPGPTARAVARLVPRWPLGDVEILTTNNDPLLSRALDELIKDERKQGRGVHGLSGAIAGAAGPQLSRKRLVVRHLHGALDPAARASMEKKPIVIAESDYHGVQEAESWQRAQLVDLLANSTCVFVGASMTDVNVLRFLRLARPTGDARHVALLTRPPVEGSAAAAGALRDAVSARWAEYGVTALYPRFFLETSQFLEELARRRAAVAAGEPPDPPAGRFRARLATWETAIGQARLKQSPPQELAAAQDQITSLLSTWLDEVIQRLPGRLRAEWRRETFGLQLWVAQDSGKKLLLWGQSTASWRDAAAFEPVPVTQPSRWSCVDAYCAGSPVLRVFGPEVGTRWHSTLNVPIFVDGSDCGRLPVGVLALSAIDRQSDAVLTRLTRVEWAPIVNVMQAAATIYLDPEQGLPLAAAPRERATTAAPAPRGGRTRGRRGIGADDT
ncbi:MAG: hypothetical protein JWM93_1881 [Frankiales bacterium]|nr:hypothetical protein [Frankiales bacterium]